MNQNLKYDELVRFNHIVKPLIVKSSTTHNNISKTYFYTGFYENSTVPVIYMRRLILRKTDNRGLERGGEVIKTYKNYNLTEKLHAIKMESLDIYLQYLNSFS